MKGKYGLKIAAFALALGSGLLLDANLGRIIDTGSIVGSAEAARRGFWFGWFEPEPFYFPSPWRNRRYVLHRKDRPKKKIARPAQSKIARPVQRKIARPVQRKTDVKALRAAEVAKSKPALLEHRVSCEAAQAIVADYGFKDIKVESCSGKLLDFSAMRDGKAFSIKIVARDGELAAVRRLQ